MFPLNFFEVLKILETAGHDLIAVIFIAWLFNSCEIILYILQVNLGFDHFFGFLSKLTIFRWILKFKLEFDILLNLCQGVKNELIEFFTIWLSQIHNNDFFSVFFILLVVDLIIVLKDFHEDLVM